MHYGWKILIIKGRRKIVKIINWLIVFNTDDKSPCLSIPLWVFMAHIAIWIFFLMSLMIYLVVSISNDLGFIWSFKWNVFKLPVSLLTSLMHMLSMPLCLSKYSRKTLFQYVSYVILPKPEISFSGVPGCRR